MSETIVDASDLHVLRAAGSINEMLYKRAASILEMGDQVVYDFMAKRKTDKSPSGFKVVSIKPLGSNGPVYSIAVREKRRRKEHVAK
jgi:hypothetical protein